MADTTAIALITPMELIARAADSGASIEQMAQLFELKLRVEADEARKAFNESMARFKRTPPTIRKNVQKKAGQIDLHYASLDNVVATITPSLSAVGIRHRWENKQDGGMIAVTCILSHDLGHSESTTLAALPDPSGSKNSIQAIASTVTYLQRYTLLGATGLAATGADDDGSQAAGPQMEEHDVVGWLDSIEAAATEDELRKFFGVAYKAAEKVCDKGAMAAFIKAKDTRKKELA